MTTVEALDIALRHMNQRWTDDEDRRAIDMVKVLRDDIEGEGKLFDYAGGGGPTPLLVDMMTVLRAGGLHRRGDLVRLYGLGARIVLDTLYACGLVRELNIEDPDPAEHAIQWIQ